MWRGRRHLGRRMRIVISWPLGRVGLPFLLAATQPWACSNGANGTAEGSGGSESTGHTGGSAGGPSDLGLAGSLPDTMATGGSAAGPAGSGGSVELDHDGADRLEVAGGSYLMGRSEDGSDACPSDQSCAPGEMPEHTVTIGRFWLDRFEVSVERFRPFYDAYPVGVVPTAGAGAHPLLPGSGWQDDFAVDLPESREQLLAQLACGETATFSGEASGREDWPVNCVSWVIAFSFCAASGGRLPSEAEWERAAAGGDENRRYPWGAGSPDVERASFFPGALGAVGSHASGRGRYGHDDLAGSVWEWALDWLDTNWYAAGGAECQDCARVSTGTHRVLRGGAYSFEAVTLRAAARSGELPSAHQPSIGFRCAYDDPPG
jgi:sulfatase modifying factor 1